MRRIVLLIVLVVGVARVLGPCANPPNAEVEIRALLNSQAAAWNRGDVQEFMATYWNSEETTFAGAKGVVSGWRAVFDRYRREYPDRKAMGTVAFSKVEVTWLAPDAALVLGHWQLERDKDRPGGVFTLVMRRFPEGWRIIHDHTTVVNTQNH